MALWDWITRTMALTPVLEDPPKDARKARQKMAAEAAQMRAIDSFTDYPGLTEQLLRVQGLLPRPWRAPSIAEALGFPAIQRAVTLISNTTGSLTMEGYRNGAKMPEAPKLVARPDPYCTPRDFYRDTAYNQATRGEFVWWIASRDADNLATALVVVPLAELSVTENTRDRLRPTYRWGKEESTRWSPANPNGDFVHVTYLKEPGLLRGMGPLQMCGAATSVAVESQEWAANFFSDGGLPSVVIKAAGTLGDDPETGVSEAETLKQQIALRDHNTPIVIDDGVESIEDFAVNQAGAQMLQARDYGNGEVARMFGLPGSLLDYGGSGSSITYQTVAEEYTKFVRTCLAISYLEPIEQAISDLLPRSTAARFNVKALLRADIKTRFEVYDLAIKNGIFDPQTAAAEEGYVAGDVEYKPIPFAPPAAVPASLPQVRTEETAPVVVATTGQVRCDGKRILRGNIRPCGKLLAEAGPFVGRCPRCGKVYEVAA